MPSSKAKETMLDKEVELLKRIAESVGSLFQDLDTPAETGKNEIVFDQEICAELWDHYQDWQEFASKNSEAS